MRLTKSIHCMHGEAKCGTSLLWCVIQLFGSKLDFFYETASVVNSFAYQMYSKWVMIGNSWCVHAKNFRTQARG